MTNFLKEKKWIVRSDVGLYYRFEITQSDTELKGKVLFLGHDPNATPQKDADINGKIVGNQFTINAKYFDNTIDEINGTINYLDHMSGVLVNLSPGDNFGVNTTWEGTIIT